MKAGTVFMILHVLAFLFGFVLLFFTIPAHLIYLALNKKEAPP